MAESKIKKIGDVSYGGSIGNQTIFNYVKNVMPTGVHTFRFQESSDHPAGVAAVGCGIAFKPLDSGAYSLVFAFTVGNCYVSDQIAPNDTSLHWNRLARVN